MPQFHLSVNGTEHELTAAADTPLLYVLRNDLGLKAAHFGCGTGQCGACRVLLDGRAVASCDTPLWAAAGKRITSVEGLGDAAHPHPLQSALIAEQAGQCGYCLPGILISAAALLDGNPVPSESEVRAALDQNLCRCGAHNRIVRAVLRAAEGGQQGAAHPLCADASGRDWCQTATLPWREAEQGFGGGAAVNLAYRLAAGGSGKLPRLPGSLHFNRRLAQWLRFLPDGGIEVRSGKVEIGQGIATALAQIAAEELDVRIERIRMVAASTTGGPNEGVTSGSLSIQDSGAALRHACAEARAIYLEAAAARLGVPAESLSVADGEIVGANGGRTSYAEIADGVLLEREATASVLPKNASLHRIVGASLPRLDLSAKVYGRPCFVQDLDLPGMLHARALRPPSPAATLVSLEDMRARAQPGVVAVVRDGSFVGVLTEREEIALKALDDLREGAAWREMQTLPDAAALGDWLQAQPAETQVVGERGVSTAAGVTETRRERYTRPYLAHASIAPSCAVAQWDAGRLRVWSHSQGIYNLRTDLALAFALPVESVAVLHVEGAGCYGHNGADDAAFDAALLARAAAGRPVKLQWTRADELSWAPFGPAMAVEIEADLDANGAIVAWRHGIWSNGHSSRPGRAKTPALLAAAHLDPAFERPIAINPPLAAGGGAERNAVPAYDLPAWRILSHRLLAMPIRTSALRSLGAFANVFAIESFVDALAAGRGEDPLAYRLRLLSEPRARAVLEAAARRANWAGWTKREGRGHGIGFARYKGSGAWCAVIAEIEAGREIRVRRLVIAVDVGLAINPDGVANQIEGGAIQAASWTLKEQVRFDRTRITSDTWDDYPILRFSEVPAVEVEILPRPQAPSLGAGEAAQGPTAAAIANAVFDALGVRVRDLPITPERIIAAAT